MEDELSVFLEGKTLLNLRVVDLKQELEKRGLSKSGSKKDLLKRLKQQLEFEKLCGERKQTGDCDVKLELDADTERNEFVQQYLAQQQKIIAEKKEVKRLIELEEQQNTSEEVEGGSHSPNKAVFVADEEEEPGDNSDDEIVVEHDNGTIKVTLERTEDCQENDVSSSQICEPSPFDLALEFSGCPGNQDNPNNLNVSQEIVSNSYGETSETTNSVLQEETLIMEPTMQESSVPYSLSDIQLPDSPGSKIKPVSKAISDDGISMSSREEPIGNMNDCDVKSNGMEFTGSSSSNLEKSTLKRKSEEEALGIDTNPLHRKSFKVDSSEPGGTQESRAPFESSEECAASEEKSKTDKREKGFNLKNVKENEELKNETAIQSEENEIKGNDSSVDSTNKSKKGECRGWDQKSKHRNEDKGSSKTRNKEHSPRKSHKHKLFRSRSRSCEAERSSKSRSREGSPKKASKHKSVRSRSRSSEHKKSAKNTSKHKYAKKSRSRSREVERSSKSKSREHSPNSVFKRKSVKSHSDDQKNRLGEMASKKIFKHKSRRKSQSRSSEDRNSSKSRSREHSPQKNSKHKSRRSSKSSGDRSISKSRSRELSPKKMKPRSLSSEVMERSLIERERGSLIERERGPAETPENEFFNICPEQSFEEMSLKNQSNESSPKNCSKTKSQSPEETDIGSKGNSHEQTSENKIEAIASYLIPEVEPGSFESKSIEQDSDLALC